MARKFFAVFAVLLLFLTAFGAGYDYRGDDAELVEYINTLAKDHGLPPELIYAVIEKESSWRADALNAAGNCIGLMQISTVNLGWLGESLGVEDLYDPFQNVLAGISMLASYVEAYGDYHMALMCYNCGSGGAKKLFDQGVYSSTYSRWVVGRMEELDAQSYPVTTDTRPQSYSSPDTAGSSDMAGQSLDNAAPGEPETEAKPDEPAAQMLLPFDTAPAGQPEPETAPQPEPGDIPAADAVPELLEEDGMVLPTDSRFTVIHARDAEQEDPTRPVCAAVSAK